MHKYYLILFACCFAACHQSKNEEKTYLPITEDTGSSDFAHIDSVAIQQLMDKGEVGDLKAIAHLFSYPIERPYPLYPIKDSAEFVHYGEFIFDDSLKTVLANTGIKDWELMGWRGIMFLNGEYFWATGYESGKISAINYFSPEEQALWKTEVWREIGTLHPALQEGIEEPVTALQSLDGKWIARLDRMRSERHRLALYEKSMTLSGMPYFVAEENIDKKEGSIGNDYFAFENDSLEIELLLPPGYAETSLLIIKENSPLPSDSSQTEEEGERYEMERTYWLDCIKNAMF